MLIQRYNQLPKRYTVYVPSAARGSNHNSFLAVAEYIWGRLGAVVSHRCGGLETNKEIDLIAAFLHLYSLDRYGGCSVLY